MTKKIKSKAKKRGADGASKTISDAEVHRLFQKTLIEYGPLLARLAGVEKREHEASKSQSEVAESKDQE